MKAIKFAALLLAITAVVSCQKEDPTPTYDTDPEAVKFTATVSSPFTRSNPIDDAAGTAFKPGDVLAVSAGAQTEVKYTPGADNAWTPEAGKYLRWEAEAMNFNAYYPAGVNNASMTAFDLPTYQSTLALIEQADYMTYTSPAPQAKAESLNLAMTRKMARVIVSTTLLDTHIGYTVEKIEVHSNTNGYTGGKPRSGQITIASLKNTDGKSTDAKHYALLAPATLDAAATFLTLTVKKTDDATTATLTLPGIPALEAGKSYAYTVEVGNKTVKITSTAVTDWTTGKVIPGGEATRSEATRGEATRSEATRGEATNK